MKQTAKKYKHTKKSGFPRFFILRLITAATVVIVCVACNAVVVSVAAATAGMTTVVVRRIAAYAAVISVTEATARTAATIIVIVVGVACNAIIVAANTPNKYHDKNYPNPIAAAVIISKETHKITSFIGISLLQYANGRFFVTKISVLIH